VATDQVGSPRVVSDATGTVVKTVDYDAFGHVRMDSAASFSVPLGFAGGLADPVTGLLRFGLRDYDPVTGRWTTRDPAGLTAGPDAYAYVGQDPASHIDPSGLSEAEDEEDPMTQDIKLDLWEYNKERLERLYESAKDGVRGFLASKLCLGQVCVNPDHPELSVGQDVKIGTGDNAVVSVGLKCSVGITENPNLHEDNFDWKAKFAAAIPSLKKIPLVGKYFGIDETYSGSGGAVNNFFGLNRTLMHGPELGVGVKGVDDMNTYGGGVPESDVNYGGN
jgi:RHS repeat-associated protein